MPKKPENAGQQWTPKDELQLKDLADKNTPTRVIGLKMGRTEDAIRSKAAKLEVSLKPVNQAPYNRTKK